VLRLQPLKFSRHIGDYGRILKTGLPSFCRQGLASISTVLLNQNAAVYGDAAVAAMSIVGRVFMLILSVLLGYGQGFQPVIGYNYGAKRYDRVRQSFFFTVKVGFALMAVLATAGILAAPAVIGWFSQDAQVLQIGIFAMRAQCLGMLLQPLGVISNMTFQSLGKSGPATFLSAARQGIFFLPLILILPQVMGLAGVQLTQPLADVCTFFACFPFLLRFFRELRVQESQEAEADQALRTA
jgi:Na+-driven multidrug efflux pump